MHDPFVFDLSLPEGGLATIQTLEASSYAGLLPLY
jgi:hypothetical protein